MAICGMKKLSVITMRDDADRLLYTLQRLRCVELIQQKNTEETQRTDTEETAERKRVEASVAQARQAISFVSEYQTKRRALFASSEPVAWDAEWPAGDELVQNCVSLAERRQKLLTKEKNLRDALLGLTPWREYRHPLPSSHTAYTETICGLLPASVTDQELQNLLGAYACITEILPPMSDTVRRVPVGSGLYAMQQTPVDKSVQPTAVTFWKAEREAVLQSLGTLGFVQTPFHASEEEGYAEGVWNQTARELEKTKAALETIRQEAQKLSAHVEEIERYVDLLTTRQARLEAAETLTLTAQTACLEGWVPEEAVEKVTAILEERGDAYELRAPTPGEDVPVQMQNGAIVSQFEPVVALYSLPAYGSFDPTAVMTPFYIIIFGLMFADFGYGLLLTAACLAASRLLHPSGTLGKFLRMFAMCGGSMMVMGVIFGGYFGDLPQAIFQNFGGRTEALDLSLWFNPLNDPMRFLLISLGLGAVHLIAALCVNFYVLWKRGDYVGAICDAGSWILLFLGAGAAMLWTKVGLAIVLLALLMLVATQGRQEKNPVMKVLKGIMSLYGIVGYISDLLSYSRILSLGLASAVIASVFNIIGTMAGPSVVGIILLLVVGVIGHTLNLAINLLGTFVHTSRLQYIEFFGKFYEDGGRPFAPLSPRAQYLHLE